MVSVGTAPGRTLFLDEEEYLYFSGTSYLGMSHNPYFREILWEGFKRYGTNYGNSRISNLQLKVFDEAENHLARHSGAEAAVTTSSGYLAGQVAFGLFCESEHIFFAPNVHPAVCPAKFSPYNGTFLQWKDYVSEQVKYIKSGTILLVSNSLDPLFLEPYEFSWLGALPAEKDIVVIIDDSHGYGITGVNGGGIFAQLCTLSNIKLIVTASLGKACGIPGGLILSGKEVIDSIKSTKIFAGSSPIVPAYVYALLHSHEILGEALVKLQQNINLFQEVLRHNNSFLSYENYPVYYTPENDLYLYLKKNKIFISSFPYPSEGSPHITRIVLNSLHLEEDICRLADLLGNRGRAT